MDATHIRHEVEVELVNDGSGKGGYSVRLTIKLLQRNLFEPGGIAVFPVVRFVSKELTDSSEDDKEHLLDIEREFC